MKYKIPAFVFLVGLSFATLNTKDSNAATSFSLHVGGPAVVYRDPYPSYPQRTRYEEVTVYKERSYPRYREVAYENPRYSRYEEVREYEHDRECRHHRHHGHHYGWWR